MSFVVPLLVNRGGIGHSHEPMYDDRKWTPDKQVDALKERVAPESLRTVRHTLPTGFSRHLLPHTTTTNSA